MTPTIKPWIFSLIILPLSYMTQAVATEHEHEEHGAHVHGEAQLLIAVEGDALEIEFDSPAMNIVGFEHQPANDAQTHAVEAALATMKKPELLFIIPATAKCESTAVAVESALTEHEHEDEHEDEHEHSDITGHYSFRCADMSQLSGIEINIFKQFPGTESIDVQTISQQGQSTTELSPENSSIKF